MNLAIFSPHEDLGDYTNRNIIYSVWLKKKKVNTSLYVSNFNYKTKKKKKLKNFFYEKQYYKGINIYRVYSTKFNDNGIARFFSYLVFSFFCIVVFFFIDNKKYEYIIGESVPPLCSLVAYLCSIKKNSKFIYKIRDPWPVSLAFSGLMKKNSLIYNFFEFLNEFLIKKSKFIISVLPFLKNYYRKQYNYRRKIYYLRNPADVSNYKVLPYPKIQDKIKVIFVGGFTPGFQMMNYFKAINLIQKKNKNFNFSYYFYGKGMDLEKCKNFVNFNKLKDVYFYKSKTKKEILKFVSNSHLCMAIVSKNKNNLFGYNLNKVIDYAVCGRPIIFTNNLKRNQFVQNYKMGYNSTNKPTDIANKIMLFKQTSYLEKKQMAHNSRKFALDNLDIKKLYKTYFNILSKNL